MIEHDTKRRDGVADPENRVEQRHARVRRVHHEIRVGQPLQAADERRIGGLLRDVSSPEIAAANPAEQRVLVISIEVLRKLRLLRLEIPDDAHDDRVTLRDFQDPEVVFDPWTRLDLDRADDTEWGREPAIAIGIRSNRRLTRRGTRTAVRRALRPRRIEEMDVRIDDWNRRRLRGVRV